jgi:AraC-like DNA-binding protein
MNYLEFHSVLFNFHDVILLMTALQCLLFALLLCATNIHHVKSTFFLAAFLFAHSLIPINELMMWGAEFKLHARQQWPSLYFLPSIAYYFDGPLLFLCIKSLVFRDFALKKIDLLHLTPFVAYGAFIFLAFYGNTPNVRAELLNSESFIYSTSYVTMEFFSKLVRICYAIACVVLLIQYDNKLQDRYSNLQKAHILWLKALVIGFLIVMIFDLILASAKTITPAHIIYSKIGLTGYYTTFILVNVLVFTAIRSFSMFEQVSQQDMHKTPIDDHMVNPQIANDIDNHIREHKLYMDPDITLDRLAEELEILPRDLSMLINRHFGINFYTFINRYRIDEAKRMLKDRTIKDTITEIYLAVGFNSKSVFYTFFKKFESVTPTKFRQANQTL